MQLDVRQELLPGDLVIGGTLDANGNAIFEAQGADVASATELLVLTDGNRFDITGTTNIATIEDTADAWPVGATFRAKFLGVLDLIDSASLVLIGGANITVAVGDFGDFTKTASGVWEMSSFNGITSTADMQAGVNTKPSLMSAADVAAAIAALGGVNLYASSGQTITSGGLLTLAHSLGEKPKFITAYIKCTTTDAGYAVGDEVEVSLVVNVTSSINNANGVYADATNVYFRISSTAQVFLVGHKSTGAASLLTNSNWDLYVRALA